MWEGYAVPGGTYRENLLRTPGQSTTPEGHPSRQFSYDMLKEKFADENGDITINRQEPVKEEENEMEKIAPVVIGLTLGEQPVVVKLSA
jgi:hypothetical protein